MSTLTTNQPKIDRPNSDRPNSVEVQTLLTTNQPKIDRPNSVEVQTFDDTSFQPQTSSDPQKVTNDERSIRDTSHKHNGSDAPKINIMDLVGLIGMVDAVPTGLPKGLYDQFKIYSNGGTRRLYVYVMDSAGVGAWRYVALA